MNRMTQMSCLWALLLLQLFIPLRLSAMPLLSDMYKHGEGEMSFLFWTLYKAELYSGQPDFDIKRYPQALKITYLRDISQQDLIEATQKQWRELGLNLPDESQWLKDLASIWPDVNEGDVITLIVDEQQVSHFYLSNDLTLPNNDSVKSLGRLENQAFGSSFLAIWLSKDTSRPDLRTQLIGY
ncbi:chalcone isomerase family protein [Moritella dasanensis]|uniref:chalcone isomerase family protein n=1 Tax=Moritella dasanensis TaxID=428031 RepID=UPI00031A3657|nr:chalcone isomerase family protein [Moritella dasanensis]